MEYYVYIATNVRNTVLYAGVTNNLTRRIFEHKEKVTESFTEKYNVCKLVYFEAFNDPNDAIAAEKRIKGWTRKRKIELVKSLNPNFKDLLL
jgi:putative endonuclease